MHLGLVIAEGRAVMYLSSSFHLTAAFCLFASPPPRPPAPRWGHSQAAVHCRRQTAFRRPKIAYLMSSSRLSVFVIRLWNDRDRFGLIIDQREKIRSSLNNLLGPKCLRDGRVVLAKDETVSLRTKRPENVNSLPQFSSFVLLANQTFLFPHQYRRSISFLRATSPEPSYCNLFFGANGATQKAIAIKLKRCANIYRRGRQ